MSAGGILLRLSENETDPELVKVLQERLFAIFACGPAVAAGGRGGCEDGAIFAMGCGLGHEDVIRWIGRRTAFYGDDMRRSRKRLESALQVGMGVIVGGRGEITAQLAYLQSGEGGVGVGPDGGEGVEE